MEQYVISKAYLEELLINNSKALVGQIMKRFEIFDDKEIIKKSVKELIYENQRKIQTLIASFSCGVEFVVPKKIKE